MWFAASISLTFGLMYFGINVDSINEDEWGLWIKNTTKIY